MEQGYEEIAKRFKAFCDPKRLAILEGLQSGEKCACVLIDEMDIGQSTLSYHMKILCESGMVQSRQEGKWTHYHLCAEAGTRTAALLTQITTPYAERPDGFAGESPDLLAQKEPAHHEETDDRQG